MKLHWQMHGTFGFLLGLLPEEERVEDPRNAGVLRPEALVQITTVTV